MGDDAPFLFAVTDTFVLGERGIVAGGRIGAGVARMGDEVEVCFAGRTAPAVSAGIEMIGRACFGPPGERNAILLRGLAAGEIGAGALVRRRSADRQST